MLKDIIPMFYMPLYVYHYEQHSDYKAAALEYLKQEQIYENYSSEPHIKLSDGSLHREPIFQPYYHFMKECLDITMQDMGYNQRQSVTSMWATRQNKGMYHHPHKHGNSFLAGVFYFHGKNGTRGTTFMNTDNLLQIQPNIDTTKKLRFIEIWLVLELLLIFMMK